MHPLNALAIFLLGVITIICSWGTFTRLFKDNLMQRLGMILTLFGSLSMMGFVWRLDYIPMGALTLIFGVTAFAVGTVARVYNKRKKESSYGRIHYRQHHS